MSGMPHKLRNKITGHVFIQTDDGRYTRTDQFGYTYLVFLVKSDVGDSFLEVYS